MVNIIVFCYSYYLTTIFTIRKEQLKMYFRNDINDNLINKGCIVNMVHIILVVVFITECKPLKKN